MRTWEYKQFENQHKAGEFIRGLFSENVQVSFGFPKKFVIQENPIFSYKYSLVIRLLYDPVMYSLLSQEKPLFS